MKYYIEKYHPVTIFFVVIIILFKYYNLIPQLSELVIQITDNALNIAVTLFGFFLTILTLVSTINTRRMNFVKQMNYFNTLMAYLKISIVSNLFLIAISFIVKLLDNSSAQLIYKERNLFYIFFLAYFTYTLLVSFRFTFIFTTLLTDPKETAEPINKKESSA